MNVTVFGATGVVGGALLPLLDDDPEVAVQAATDAVSGYAERYDRYWTEGMAAKLGLPAVEADGSTRALIDDLLPLLAGQRVDHTNFFRALSAGTARDLFVDREAFDAWAARRDALLPAERDAVATAIASSVAVLNPAAVLIGGPWGTMAGFTEEVAGQVADRSVLRTEIRPVQLGGDSPQIGAGIRAVQAAQSVLVGWLGQG